MRFDFLATPVADDSPTGPDLDLEGDNGYLTYLLPAQSRLPRSYFDNDGVPFDRTKIDVAEEVRAVAGFLQRSYDIRLLVLEARFQAINGSFLGLAECMEGLALLLESYWAEAHPADDLEARTIALASLDGQSQFVVPLHYLHLVSGNRQVLVTYRRYMVAAGQAQPREGEEQVALSQIVSALQAEENREALLAAHAAIQRALDALVRIDQVYRDNAGVGLRIVALPALLRQLADLIAAHVEGLLPLAVEVEPGSDGAEAGDGSMAASRTAVGPVRHDANSPIQSRSDASHALACIEAYYMACEPSALALVLVHQARMLEGRPLVEAIEALAPDRANDVQIKVGPEGLFTIGMGRMKLVTEDAISGLLPVTESEAPNPLIVVSNRSEAALLMGQAEAYYRAMEPASPIPLLLNGAQTSVDRDFMSILKGILSLEIG